MTPSDTSATAPAKPPLCYCRECGAPFYRVRHDQVFCPAPRTCRQDFNARRMLGGLKLYDAAMQWRIERLPGALSEFTALVDNLAYDERERRRKRKAAVDAHKAALKAQRAAG